MVLTKDFTQQKLMEKNDLLILSHLFNKKWEFTSMVKRVEFTLVVMVTNSAFEKQ